MSACEHGWASENYVKCPRCYDKARYAEEVSRLTRERDAAQREANAYLGAIGGLKRERDDLSASLAAARDVLRQVEWRMRHESGMVNDWYCPVCGGYKSRGHVNDCPLARALGAEGGER